MGQPAKPGAVQEHLHKGIIKQLCPGMDSHTRAIKSILMNTGRRKLLKGLGVFPFMLCTNNMSVNARPKPDAHRIRYSVNAYSFNTMLRNGQMTFSDMMDFAAGIGLDAVDLTGYYFANYPEVPSDAELFQLKRKALKLGLDISWTGIRNDFATPDTDARKADLLLIRNWLTASSKLGAPIMRIFAGTNKHESFSREAVKEWMVEEFKICAKYGAETGVLPALQHHNDFLFTSDEVIEILNRVDSDWLGLILDVGSLRRHDPYSEISKLLPYADYIFIKEFVYINGQATPIDMNRMAAVLHASDYSGYVSFESLSDGDPKEIVTTMFRDFKTAFEKI
jgi:sugar phosphate isomerase/epimerase